MQRPIAQNVHRSQIFCFDALEWSVLIGGIVCGALLLMVI